MGLFDFARDAGAKLGIGKSTAERKADAAAKAAAEAAVERAREQAVADAEARELAKKAKAATDAAAKAAADQAASAAAHKAVAARQAAVAAAQEAKKEFEKSSALEEYVTKMGLKVKNLDIRYDNGCAYIEGECDSQAELEKVVLAVGNVAEVDRVIETIDVVAPADLSQIHTVVSGDTLSKISKHYYGDANKYNVIFEANKPMLSHPDKIFPGQALRIPPL